MTTTDTSWETRAAMLAATLTESGDLHDPAWAAAITATPRHRLVPTAYQQQPDGSWAQIDTTNEEGLALVYSPTTLVTEVDIQGRAVSSSTKPDLMLRMLETLDVHDGHRVLEIGTGTGYNAALLAERLGNENVTTVEVDTALADQARSALTAAGCMSMVVCGDGAAGWPAGAPFDRIIVTAAVKLGRVPYAWVEQAASGGLILAPLKTDFTTGPLVAFTVGQDGTATGHVVPLRVAFMELRAQRTPVTGWDCLRWDDPDAALTHTEVMPWTTLGNEAPQWAIAVAVPSCRYELWPRTPGRNPRHGVAWLGDPLSGSWASVIPSHTKDQYEVRQRGPRHLWDEVETAYHWWVEQDKPTLNQWKFTVSPDRQTAGVGR
jgi:protein-L-isoaspartate(D-aspartate) O-methyltransferase